MILSDGTLVELLASGRLVVDPLDASAVQPASIDVRLGGEFLVFRNHTRDVIDPYDRPSDLMERVTTADGQPFVLHPGEFVLGTTLEAIGLPDDLVARVEGKSSLGRLGLLIHATAGFVDPGWPRGQITLELSNVATLPIRLWPGMRVGQLSFSRLDAPARRPYGSPGLASKYAGQRGPVASRYEQRPGDGAPRESGAGHEHAPGQTAPDSSAGVLPQGGPAGGAQPSSAAAGEEKV